MISVSPAAQAAISAGATVYARGTILAAGVALMNVAIEGTPSLTVDGTAAVVRSVDGLTIGDLTGLLPFNNYSPIAPFGNELALFSGLYLPAGTPITLPTQAVQPDGSVLESWPVGVFMIDDPTLSDSAAGLALALKGYDRGMTISRRSLPSAYVIAAGTPLVVDPAGPGLRPTGAIADLINSVMPGLTYSFAPTSATTPALVFTEGDDPWQHAQDMAGSAGMRLYFDAYGTCVLAPAPDPNAAVTVWTYQEGDDLELVEQTLSSTTSYSHAVVIGEPLDGSPPVRSDAFDSDPASPTYYLGPFGDRPVFLRSPLIRTQAQADGASAALLLRKKGATQQVRFGALPVSAHDAYDAVRVMRGGSSGLDAVFLMEKFTMPLGPAGSADVTCAGRRLG